MTGDVGAWDPSGRLLVVDRRKDIVISGGVNVSPTAVERRLATAPASPRSRVVGAPDDEWGERVVACVVPAGAAPSLADLRAYGTSVGLTAAELPREVRIVAAIPRSAGGKLRRHASAGLTASQPDGASG